MKTTVKTAVTALSLLAFGLLASCADSTSVPSHEMGAPGKSRPMADADMQSTSR